MAWPGRCLWDEYFSVGILIDSSTNTFPTQLIRDHNSCIFFSVSWTQWCERQTLQQTLSDSDAFLGTTKVEHQLSSPSCINSHRHLSISLISARFFHLCEEYSWCSDSGLSFDILLTIKTGNWPLETSEDLYSYWHTSESSCLGIFVPHCLDTECVL